MHLVTEQDLRGVLGRDVEDVEPREELWNQIHAKSIAGVQKRITIRPSLWSRLQLGPKLELAAACILLVGLVGIAAVRNLNSNQGPASGQQTFTAAAALQAVITSDKSNSWMFATFPKSIGKVKCQIPRGGIGTTLIEGTCETKVDADGRNFVVSLVQTWDAKDFREGHSASTGELTQTWQFKVDADGTVHDPTIYGDFPPQLVK